MEELMEQQRLYKILKEQDEKDAKEAASKSS